MRGFDFYYFIDKEEENCTRLELKLSQYPTKGIRQFRPGDANTQARMLADALKRDNRLKALCFLDPFGMSIDWGTIEALSGKSIDLWILIPSGVILKHSSLKKIPLTEEPLGSYCPWGCKSRTGLSTHSNRTLTVLCLVTQFCPTLCDPMNCSLPGSTVHGDSPGKDAGVSCHAFL